ncbi:MULTISPECIES: pirin family protein [Methylobacterium]|uniref:pirin family protein n=1 Tax=Methylobacterium TaxID=407 RepID=UPI0019D0628F|nr:pirin family protein [Methylobacterium sp. DB0501]
MIAKAERTTENAIASVGFVARAYFPGHLEHGLADHGLGPLATIMESFLAPGTHIKLHEHVQDEIISWVPAGIMRHDDPQGGHLTLDADHLMIMNAGRGFQHEERTRNDDPPLRMLQIFVRPQVADLDPHIQHGRLPKLETNRWRHVFGPTGSEARFTVRNAVECHDIRMNSGDTTILPSRSGWRTYFFIFSGCIEAEEQTFSEAESGLCPEGAEVRMRAISESLVVAFVVDPNASVYRVGTVGDGETVRRMAAHVRS